MIKKCNYSSFFNEFEISINIKYYLIPFFNGYYFAEEYEKNLHYKIDNYKYDLLYELPLSNDGEPIIFLNNLYEELCKKERKLKRLKKYSRKKIQSPSFRNKFNLLNNIENKYYRRNFKMQNKQLVVLQNAISITEQAINSFNQDMVKDEMSVYEKEKPKTIENNSLKSKSKIVWNGEKVGLIQLIKSLIKSEEVLIGSLRENEAVKLFSDFLNVSIDRNNLSSFSRAIHSNNYDYQPEIFKKITNGYEMIVFEKQKKLELSRK